MGGQLSKKTIIIIHDVQQNQEYNDQSIKIKMFQFQWATDLLLSVMTYFKQQYKVQFFNKFQQFIQKYSLKEVLCIIACVQNNKKNESKSVKSKLLTYIKKYSEEKIKLYYYIRDICNYKLPDHQAPYVLLVSDQAQQILENIKFNINQSGDGGRVNIQLRRIIKSLYRIIMVKIIDNSYIQKKKLQKNQTKQIQTMMDTFIQKSISFQFFNNVNDFKRSTISTICNYIICRPQNLLQIVQLKNMEEYEFKIIVFGELDKDNQKKKYVWTSDHSISSIADKMQRCSTIQKFKTRINSNNTIFFGQSSLFKNNLTQIEKIVETNTHKKKANNQIGQEYIKYCTQINQMKKLCQLYYYSLVISFQSSNLNKIKKYLEKNGLQNRVYLTNIDDYDKKLSDQQIISNKMKFFMEKINFYISCQILPLDAITIFKTTSSKDQVKFFRDKMGFQVDIISSKNEFQTNYLPPYYKNIIKSYHLLCNIDDYKNYLKNIFEKQKSVKDSYLTAVKIIIYDNIEKIQKAKKEGLFDNQENVYVDYSLNHIRQYVSFQQAPIINLPFFGKGVLKNFLQSATVTKHLNKNNYMFLQCSLNSRNQLFQQVFQGSRIQTRYYQSIFLKFSKNNRDMQEQLAQYQTNFIPKYAKLWKLRHQFLEQSENMDRLKSEIKTCFYKCKIYELLKVSDQQFQHFYIKKINDCRTFIDLQVCVIYIYSLPHGLNQLVTQIFRRPRKTCLLIKIFCAFVVVLLTNFCSFQQQTLNRQSLALYINDESLMKYAINLNQGDLMHCITFLHCFRNEDEGQDTQNRFILWVQTVPFLALSKIKKSMQIEKFAFYKEGIQFLIAPYSKFRIIKKQFNKKNKYTFHLELVEVFQTQGFMTEVFKANNITAQKLSNRIKSQLKHNYEFKTILQQKSLYKKAEQISLYQQKNILIQSIKQGLLYDKFYDAQLKKKNFSAQIALQQKIERSKMSNNHQTKCMQENYVNEMLNAQRALLLYRTSSYSNAIEKLKNLEQFLKKQEVQGQKNWISTKITTTRENVEEVYARRKLFLAKSPKIKKWKIQYTQNKQFQIKSIDMKWQSCYQQIQQIFTLVNKQEPNKLYHRVQPQTQFGKKPKSVQSNKLYETISRQAMNTVGQMVLSGIFVEAEIEKQSIKKSPIKVKQKSKSMRKNQSLHIYKQRIMEIKVQGVKQQHPSKIVKENNFFQQLKDVIKPSEVKKQQSNINNLSINSSISQQKIIEWQVFYYENKFKLVKKHKHFKAKIGQLNNGVLQSKISQNRLSFINHVTSFAIASTKNIKL